MNEEEPNPNAPTERQAARIRVPDDRHRAARVTPRSQPHGDYNTVAMPWVDFGRDVAAILAGEGIRNGNRFTVNGREYVLEGGGRLFPVSGDGLYRLGRGAYRALGLYNVRGLDASVEFELERRNVHQAERRAAQMIWRELQAWRERTV